MFSVICEGTVHPQMNQPKTAACFDADGGVFQVCNQTDFIIL